MIRMLVVRELLRLRSLFYTFFLALPILMLLFIDALQAVYGFGDEGAGQAKFWFIAVVVPLFFGILLACQLVAGDKENGRLRALLELPVPPFAVWAVKFILGWVIFFTYIIYAVIFGFAVSGEGEFLVDPLIIFALTVIFAYALAFLVSCHAPNAMTALLILMVIAIIGAIIGAGVSGLAEGGADLVEVTGIWNLDLARHDMNRTLEFLAPALDLCAVPLAILSLLYFMLYHRRLELRILPYAVLFGPLIVLAVIPCFYLAFLAVYNHPALNHYTPRIATPWLHDANNREPFNEFCRRLEDWQAQFGEQAAPLVFDPADTASIISLIHGDYLNDTANRASDTATRIIQLTEPARESLTGYMASHSLSMYIDPDSPAFRAVMPRALSLITVVKLEDLAMEREIRRGDRIAALRRYARVLRWIGNLYKDNTLIMVLVADACHGIAAEGLPTLFPFDRPGGTAAEADAVLAQMAALEAAARPALARSLEAEITYAASAYASFGTGLKGGYPLLGRRKMMEFYENAMLPLIAASRQPYHLDRSFYQDDQNFAWHDYLLCPLAPVIVDVAVPKLGSTRCKHAVCIEQGRLGQLHLQLWKFVRARNRFPATLEELWRFAGVAPMTSELTGQPYPYRVPARTARIDPEWAKNASGWFAPADTSTVIR